MVKRRNHVLRRVCLLGMLVLLVLGALPPGAWAQVGGDLVKPIQPPQEKAYIIKLTGEVDEIMAASLERRINIAIRGGATIIVYDMDAYGGIAKSALEMTRLTRTQPIPIVVWVHSKAYSYGSLVALACNQVVMGKDGSVGDCAAIVLGDAAPAADRAKANSPILADFAESAKKNGFDFKLAAAMVEQEREVDELHNAVTGEVRYTADAADKVKLLNEELKTPDGKITNPWRFEKTIDSDKQLLTVNAELALKMKLAQARADSLEDLRAVLNIKTEPVILDFTYAELFGRWLNAPWVRGILFTLMVIFAVVEFTHPGTLFGGIAALVCLVLIIAAPFMAGLTQSWEIAIIILGVAIVIIDLVFAGGIGLAAVPGFILIAVGIVGTFVPAEPGGGWVPQLPQTYSALQSGLSVVVFGTLAAIAALMVLARFINLTPGVRRLQLKPGVATVAAVRDATETPAAEAVFAGALGQASTDLRPAGKARFGPHLIDVVTEGQFVRAGELVEVLEANAARVVVKPQKTS